MPAVKPLNEYENQNIQTYSFSTGGNIGWLETCEHPADIGKSIRQGVSPVEHAAQGHQEESAPYGPLQLHIRYEALGFRMR